MEASRVPVTGKKFQSSRTGERITITKVPTSMAYAPLRRHPELVALFFVLLAASLVSAPMLFYGAPFGQDTIYHESWLHAFNAELSAGEWYPRWLHQLNGGAGSPSFFFYGPVPFYIAALFDKLLCSGCEPATQLAVGTWILLAASGMAFYALARDYARPWVAALGAIAYMVMPYHFEIDLWRRADLGEFSAYICMPLVLLFLQRSLRDTRYLPALALSYAGLAASHIPAAMLFSLFLGGYTLLLCYAQKSLRPVGYLAAGVALGMGLVAIYLVPAVGEQHYIAALRYFVPGYAPQNQLWNYEYFNYANWLFLDGLPERYNSFVTRVFNLLVGTTIVALLLILAACEKERLKKVRQLSPWILGLVFVWFMVTPLSIPVWKLFPDLRKIQFPWRSIMVAELATAVLFVIAMDTVALQKRLRSSLPLLSASALFVILLLSGERTHPGQPPYLKELAPFQSSATRDEFERKFKAGYDALEFHMPIWVGESADEFRSSIAATPNLAVVSGTGDASIVRWPSRYILLRVRLAEIGRS